MHEKRLSFISQREVRGDGDAIATAARAALREGPDVLVIEDLRAPEALVAALDAARAGRLVLGSISAPTAPGAIERLIDAFPADRRRRYGPRSPAPCGQSSRRFSCQKLPAAGSRRARCCSAARRCASSCSTARPRSCRSRLRADAAWG